MDPRADQTDGLAAAVEAARHGDQDAFRVVYRTVQPGISRYLRVLVGEQAAEDVASETWLQVVRDLGSFSGSGVDFRRWTATIARHRAMDHLRRHRRRPVHLIPVTELADLADAYDTSEEAVDAVATTDALALIATLPQDQAEAVLLRVVIGLDAGSAGRVLGKRAGAVRTAAYRGLRRLAKSLAEQPDGPVTPTRPETLKGTR